MVLLLNDIINIIRVFLGYRGCVFKEKSGLLDFLLFIFCILFCGEVFFINFFNTLCGLLLV